MDSGRESADQSGSTRTSSPPSSSGRACGRGSMAMPMPLAAARASASGSSSTITGRTLATTSSPARLFKAHGSSRPELSERRSKPR